MTDKLQQICAYKREDVARLKILTSLASLEAKARNMPPSRKFAEALRRKIHAGNVGLITEIKKASPSAGLLRPVFDPADLARSYEKGGAACLSVLTDTPSFQGCNDDLITARNACALPVLRKDFMLDVWQIAESRSLGADCVLLIMAALEDSEAQDLHAAAVDCGMDVLIETHDAKEMERALRLPSGLIGINNRNLKTLKTDLRVTAELSLLVPSDRLLVSESGIASAEDVQVLSKHGARCFLIGESLLRQKDLAEATRALNPL